MGDTFSSLTNFFCLLSSSLFIRFKTKIQNNILFKMIRNPLECKQKTLLDHGCSSIKTTYLEYNKFGEQKSAQYYFE